MREGRWDRILRELRKLVFGACCAIGGLAGMWTGIWRSPELDAQGGVFDELASTLKPMLALLRRRAGAGDRGRACSSA